MSRTDHVGEVTTLKLRPPAVSLATWMHDLGVLHLPFYKLHVPGTHNSATSIVHGFDPLDSPLGKYRALLYAFPFVPIIISLWTRCQSLDIRQQLESGVRFLDLRVAVKDGVAYVAHTLRGPTLVAVLDDIADFYEAHGTTEVCVVTLKRDFENRGTFGDPDARRVVRQTIQNHRAARYLSTVPRPLRVPLHAHQDRPLVLLIEKMLWEADGPGYAAPYFFNKWFNVGDPEILREQIRAALPAVGTPRQTMTVLQNIITPATRNIVGSALLYGMSVLSGLAVAGVGIAVTVVGPKAVGAHPAAWICVLVPMVALATVCIGLRPSLSLLSLGRTVNDNFLLDVVDENVPFNVVAVDNVTTAFARRVVELNTLDVPTTTRVSV